MQKEGYTSYKQLKEDYRAALRDAISKDRNGKKFIKEAFKEEMLRTDYLVTEDLQAVINSIGLELQDLKKENVSKGFVLAKEELQAELEKETKKNGIFLDI